MILVARADGVATEFDGCYLYAFDPQPAFEDPLGNGHLIVTRSVQSAKRFPDLSAALEFWKQVSPTVPLRTDGKPNRPLTAWTATFETVRHDELNNEPIITNQTM
jgi:hypothetical protein